MIPLPITVTPQSVPATYTVPNDMQGVLEAIAQFTTYETDVSGPAIVVSPTGVETEPGTGQQVGADPNGIWIWVLGPGSWQDPLAPRVMAVYANQWLPVYTGNPGKIAMFFGGWVNYFDASGKWLPQQGWDGWCLCNGNNGTVNLINRFQVPGYRYDTTLGWVTNIGTYLDTGGGGAGIGGGGAGHPPIKGIATDQLNYATYIGETARVNQTQTPTDLNTGGWSEFQIMTWNLGNSAYAPGSAGFYTAGVNLDLNSNSWTNMPGNLSTVIFTTQTPFDALWTYPVDQASKMKNKPIRRLPPYIAVGFAQFMGY